jgi:hypothetical protein
MGVEFRKRQVLSLCMVNLYTVIAYLPTISRAFRTSYIYVEVDVDVFAPGKEVEREVQFSMIGLTPFARIYPRFAMKS